LSVPRFPSEAWCLEAIRLAEADPESTAASDGLVATICCVMTADAVLPKGFGFFLRVEGQHLRGFRVLEDLDEADELQPDYLARASYATWKGLLQGSMDPVEAVLLRKIEVQGNLEPLMARAGHKGLVERVLAHVPTDYADEVPGE
jgi:hypothetical protein